MYVSDIQECRGSVQFFVSLKKGELQYNHSERKGLVLERKREELRQNDFYYSIREQMSIGQRIFIYGDSAGADRADLILQGMGVEPEGYIVSNGYKRREKKNGKRVYELQELREWYGELCVILGVSYKFRRSIIEGLEDAGVFLSDKALRVV